MKYMEVYGNALAAGELMPSELYHQGGMRIYTNGDQCVYTHAQAHLWVPSGRARKLAHVQERTNIKATARACERARTGGGKCKCFPTRSKSKKNLMHI